MTETNLVKKFKKFIVGKIFLFTLSGEPGSTQATLKTCFTSSASPILAPLFADK